MHHNLSRWQKDFEEFCKNKAKGILGKFTYGRDIYTSPEIRRSRWYVFEYKGEYNVFVNKDCYNPKKLKKDLVASFKLKESALAFALKSLLISVGYMNRFGLQKAL